MTATLNLHKVFDGDDGYLDNLRVPKRMRWRFGAPRSDPGDPARRVQSLAGTTSPRQICSKVRS
jgi:hypothetical protein